LRALAETLEHGGVPRERFHEHEAESPLPRAYQWADGSAYVNHVALVRRARGAEMPERFWTDPLIYQGGCDSFLGPRDRIPLADADAGQDMTFDFGTLIAHAAKTRSLAAGSIIGSGTVSNRGADCGPGKPISEGGVGYSCLAELRTVETLLHGEPRTPFLKA